MKISPDVTILQEGNYNNNEKLFRKNANVF